MFKYSTILAFTLGALTGCAPPVADTSADLAAIKADVLDWVAAYNAGDADAVAALYSADGVVMAPGARTAHHQASGQ